MSSGLRLLEDVSPVVPAPFHGMIGVHPTMLHLFDAIGRAAPLDLPVIIQGPTGSGKELVALAVHALSGRRGPFVPVNVGTIPEQLAESELFGSARGAFTGAVAERLGLIESARGGTLFLDEAAELSVATQVRLLRVLEGGVVRPVGATNGRYVSFRLILSLQHPAGAMVGSKRWRDDFYYRVAGMPLTVPALQDRSTDILPLANHRLSSLGRPPLPARAAELLARHPWPGNVRELHRAIERAAFLSPGGPITGEAILEAAESLTPDRSWARESLPRSPLAAIERQHIEQVLGDCGYQTRAAARQLGLSLGQLYRKFRSLGITPPRSR